MPISMVKLGRQRIPIVLLIMLVALVGCSTATTAPPTVAATATGPVAKASPNAFTGSTSTAGSGIVAATASASPNAPTSSTPVSSSSGPAPDGTLQTAFARLKKATSFHFVFFDGKNRIEGDALGINGNFHYTTVTDPTDPRTGRVNGEWLIIQTSGIATIDNHQAGKWVEVNIGVGDNSFLAVATLINEVTSSAIAPTSWQASGTQKIGDQDADYYTYKDEAFTTDDAWVGKSSGDIVQLQQNTGEVLTVSNIDQPVTIPSPQ